MKSSGVISNRMDSLLCVQSSGTTADGLNSKHQRSTTHQDLMLLDRELMYNVVTVDRHHTLLGNGLILLEVGQ